jgi:4-hydroxy-tetrahydrodipicolinate reductase
MANLSSPPSSTTPHATPSRRLALVGYGKMGHMIEGLSSGQGFDVVLRLDEFNNADGKGMTREGFQNVDVAIEFSTPETAPQNLIRLAELGVTCVCGTTGWTARSLGEVTAAVEEAGTGLVWSPNFSIGVAVFQKLTSLASHLFADEASYGAWAWEIHHDQKKDAPSGTLVRLVQLMKNAGYRRNIDVSSNRAGSHPGTHEIGFDSPADTVTLRHTARSREGFALGALKSARWVHGRRGVYTFEDVLFGDRHD